MRSNLKVASAIERYRKSDPELFEPGANEIGIASDYISDIRSLKAGQRVVAYCRVSASDQARSKNLEDQVENLKRKMERLGFIVLEIIKEVASGWQEDRDGLLHATEFAVANNAVLVAESATRFIRSRDYKSTNWNVLPTKGEYRRLKRDTQGVMMATLLDPDATPEEIRSYETRRGKNAKGNPGGRPRNRFPGYKKQIRLDYLPIVLALYEQGLNTAAIARKKKLNYNTVYSWIRKYS